MVTMVGIGTLLISSGPALAIWLVLLIRRAHLLVLSILSAFMWCMSTILASVIWWAIPPWKRAYAWCLFVVVSCQELFRLLLFLVFQYLRNTSDGVEIFLRPGRKNECLSGMAIGLGYAIMAPLIHFFSILAAGYSDDTAIYIDECRINVFVAAASFALAFSIMHIMLGVIVWPAYSENNGKQYIILAYLIHIFLSQLTLINLNKNGCEATLPIILVLSVLLFMATAYIVRRRIKGNA